MAMSVSSKIGGADRVRNEALSLRCSYWGLLDKSTAGAGVHPPHTAYNEWLLVGIADDHQTDLSHIFDRITDSLTAKAAVFDATVWHMVDTP